MSAGAISLSLFVSIASACVPGADPAPMSDYALAESGRSVLALHVNGSAGRDLNPQTMPDAIETAQRLIAAGHSADIGIMQINSRHLGEPGMPRDVVEAFQLCPNIRAAARLLAEGDRIKACLYNTGRAACSNGYPERIAQATAHRLGQPVSRAFVAEPHTAQAPEQPAAPTWDSWARPAATSSTPAPTWDSWAHQPTREEEVTVTAVNHPQQRRIAVR